VANLFFLKNRSFLEDLNGYSLGMFCELSISIEEHGIRKSCWISLFADSDGFKNSEISDLLHGECLIEEFRFFEFVRLDAADEMSIAASEFLHE